VKTLAHDRRPELAARAGYSASERPRPFAWHDPNALAQLLAPYGFTVATQEQALAFTGASPDAYADAELANHPGWVEAPELLEPVGRWEQVRGNLTKLFANANEDPAACRITSRYVVAAATM
jgi:hypothetical protein